MNTKPLILVVDDDTLLARTLGDALAKKGYDVELAFNGRDGIDYALDKQPQLILLDLQMPDIDGLEVLRTLRDDERGKKLQIVFSTNIYDPNVINDALSLDVHDYILKADTSLDQITELVNHYAPLPAE